MKSKRNATAERKITTTGIVFYISITGVVRFSARGERSRKVQK